MCIPSHPIQMNAQYTFMTQMMTQIAHVSHQMTSFTMPFLQDHCNTIKSLHYKTILVLELHTIAPPKEAVTQPNLVPFLDHKHLPVTAILSLQYTIIQHTLYKAYH